MISVDSPWWKHVLRHRESENLSRAASSSYSPVHIFEHLRVKTRLTLFFYSSRFSFCSSSLNHPLLMHSIHFLLDLELEQSRIGTLVGGGTCRPFLFSTGIQNRWLIVLAHHPSIPHALQHKPTSMSGMLVLGCDICYFPDSQIRVIVIVCQRCSISYECHACACVC